MLLFEKDRTVIYFNLLKKNQGFPPTDSWGQAAGYLPAGLPPAPGPPLRDCRHCTPSYTQLKQACGPLRPEAFSLRRFLHRARRHITAFQMPGCLHSSIPNPLREQLFPRSDVCLGMYNVAKERIHLRRLTGKADVGGSQSPPSLLTYEGKPTRSVRGSEDK